MKNIFICTLLLLCSWWTETNASDNNIQQNPNRANPMMADPTIFHHNGTYYLYGTNDKRWLNPHQESTLDDGFLVYTSTDLKEWHGPMGAQNGFALLKGDSYGDKGFWAPQVFYHKNKFYMAYTANEQIAIASSDSPLGPFKQEEKRAISTTTRQIDPYIFIDNDGKIYLYHVRLTEGNKIFVATLDQELSTMDESSLKECITADAHSWEDTDNAHWKVAEGATVFKKNGWYYLLYSANDFRNPDYAVGYATSKSPYGPWKKAKENPIISRKNIGINGTGHGDILFDDNKIYYVLHTHLNPSTASPRQTALTELQIKGRSISMVPQSFAWLNHKKEYTNPIIAKSLPDPTIIQHRDSFYLYATEDTRNVPIYRSADLTDWSFIGTAFTDQTRPNFEPKGGIWAPDIQKIEDQFVLFYSMSVWGGEWTCGLGVAVADRPQGPFQDKGKLFNSTEIGVQNSIDPFYIEENGKKYLFWGSFRGIYGIELADDGLSIADKAQPIQVAGTAFEGTYIYKKDGYYYFFASVGTCCEGLESTYKLVVGRSEHLFGPYTDKEGKPMMENHYHLVIGTNDHFVGNGHNSGIVKDAKGDEWMFYHGVDVNHPKGRVLLMDQILWDAQGWPFVRNHQSPSLSAPSPSF